MADGPDIEKLFREMRCLNGTTNASEIVKYLRFAKGEDVYQKYLQHYLPMLQKEYFDQFIDDVENKELAKKLKERFKPKEVEKAVEKKEELITSENYEEPKKKPGRKPKNS